MVEPDTGHGHTTVNHVIVLSFTRLTMDAALPGLLLLPVAGLGW